MPRLLELEREEFGGAGTAERLVDFERSRNIYQMINSDTAFVPRWSRAGDVAVERVPRGRRIYILWSDEKDMEPVINRVETDFLSVLAEPYLPEPSADSPYLAEVTSKTSEKLGEWIADLQQRRSSARIEIARAIDELLAIGRRDIVEEESDSEFTVRLANLIDHYHRMALDKIELAADEGKFDPDLLSDVLATVGRATSRLTRPKRRMLLTKYLSSTHPRVRYGAIIGLAALDDPDTVAALIRARNVETVTILQGILDELIEYLSIHHTAK